MKYRLTAWFSLVLTAVSMNTAAYEMLRHNPFEQPEMNDRLWGNQGKAGVTTSMELRGTVVDGPDSLANIDGEYYRLDHQVSGYRVVRIDSGSVTLRRGGIETILTLHDDE